MENTRLANKTQFASSESCQSLIETFWSRYQRYSVEISLRVCKYTRDYVSNAK